MPHERRDLVLYSGAGTTALAFMKLSEACRETARLMLEKGALPSSEAQADQKERFSPEKFHVFRNRLRWCAKNKQSEKMSFRSGPVEIDAMSHKDGSVSWQCRFDGSDRVFSAYGAMELEELLYTSGILWDK